MSFLRRIADKAKDSVLKRFGEDDVDREEKLPFLHGLLNIHIIEAEGLPDTDTTFFNIDAKDVTDPYVTGQLGEARLFKTKFIANSLNPKWDESFEIMVCHHATSLRIDVKDKEHVGASRIASVNIRTSELLEVGTVSGWFDLFKGNTEDGGRINLSVTFTSKDALDENHKEVEHSYFSPRHGNRVVLYQDADTPPLPVFDGLTDCDGEQYVPPRAWIDLYKAICQAEKFIYITGWSVATGINLVRGDDEVDPDGDSNVGELLKRKANEGVTVLVMVWNEKLSTESNPGLMGTHDEETRLYFADSAVECLAVPRVKYQGALASQFVSSCYTHHQKSVICDAPSLDDDGRRRLVAFIGGLDITDGRYDTPEFPLFSTLNSPKHCNDFYNNCMVGVTKEVGPREPWHDCHAKVEGPIALDIMKNFEDRWRRQGDYHVNRLYHLEEEEFDMDGEIPVPNCEGGPWTVQLFRSITSDSCIFDFQRQKYLNSKDGIMVEDSIMKDMVIQIRQAKRFIYMENQYFLGSAYSWLADKNTLTQHIVPREITQKIVDKIVAGEDFKVYILIPMFPEGDPSSAAIQEILYWQYRTMQAMYRRISNAIHEFGDGDSHPTDYLAFFCLAKRESPDEVPVDELEEPSSGGMVKTVRSTLRHCVYVHSKMTIIDDDYIIVGSANINQRSLGGNRDSEIAIGAFQPDHLDTDEPRGGVHQYRMALWSAHLGGYDEAYLNPQSRECFEKVREVTMGFWELYHADEPEHSDVHMLPYPIKVDDDGDVSNMRKPYHVFPDTSAPVTGTKSGYLPGKLTT